MSSLSDTENARPSMNSAKSMKIALPKSKPETIVIADLPEEVRSAFDCFDIDGDGVITITELMEAAQAQKILKVQNSLFRKGIAFAGVFALALVATVGGLTYGIVDASKDTVVEGRALLTKDEEPVGINLNEEHITLGSLAFMPHYVPSHVGDITLKGTDGQIYYRTKKSITITPEKSVVFATLDGDIISWDKDDAANIKITLADGVTWSRPSQCRECTATSVVADADVTKALEDFEEVVSLASGRKLQWYPGCLGPIVIINPLWPFLP